MQWSSLRLSKFLDYSSIGNHRQVFHNVVSAVLEKSAGLRW
jgi:hypothetical protein